MHVHVGIHLSKNHAYYNLLPTRAIALVFKMALLLRSVSTAIPHISRKANFMRVKLHLSLIVRLGVQKDPPLRLFV